MSLFGGAIMGWRTALWMPLAIMIPSDLIIGLHPLIAYTWGGFVLVALFGMLLHDQRNRIRIPLGAVGCSLLFYVVSNFGVWLQGQLYPATWHGLIECYTLALPFLRTSFLADMTFSVVLFGLYALVEQYFKSQFMLRLAPRETEAE